MEIKNLDELKQMSSSMLHAEFGGGAYQEIDRLDDDIAEIEVDRNTHLQALLKQLGPYDDRIDEIMKEQEKIRNYTGLISMVMRGITQQMQLELNTLLARFLAGETITEEESNEWQSRWADEEE